MSANDTTPAVAATPASAPAAPSPAPATSSVVSLEPVASADGTESSADESDVAEALEMRKRRRRRRKVIFEWQCVNPVCGNHHVGKAGLVSARRFHTEYFGVGDNDEGNGKIK